MQSSEPEDTASDPSDQSEDESEDEEEAEPTSNAYSALLQSLASTQPQDRSSRKRKVQDDDQSAGQQGLKRRTKQSDLRSAAVDVLDASVEQDREPVDGDEVEDQDEADQVEEVEEDEEDTSLDNEANYPFFDSHFANPDADELTRRLKRIAENEWATRKLEAAPAKAANPWRAHKSSHTDTGRGVLQVPSTDDRALERPRFRSTRNIGLKSKLVENAQQEIGDFNNLEQTIAPSLFSYQDLLFGARTVQNAGRLRDLACLHALNHILMTRDRVLKNNAKLAAAKEDQDVEYRDQGFTRPKILFLLETKQACVRVLDSITKLHTFEQQENKKRFLDGFSQPEDKFSDDKPDDFRELFEGNDENEFRVGVKLTRKTLKLYSTFYNSDIIFASALGLRRAIETGDKKKRGDYDFLSSIEMVIMDQADATLMQNFEHAEFVFDHLNLQPKDPHGCDFSRVRSWYLDGHAPHLRQTIILSAFLTPKINSLYYKHMRNVAGRLRYTPDYTSGLIESLSYGIKQTFLRFDSPSHLTDPDARFKYFHSSILPSITRLPKPATGGVGVLVFIPSYLDFVRVRNSLVDSDFSYGLIQEYTDATDVRKARSHFMSGKHSLLLYTGRAHHFHRYQIRGVKRVVFYGVPENPKFYDEVVGFIGKSVERGEISRQEASVRVAFSKWERLELERVVGTKRVGKMIADRGDVFDFV
ncbi:U3 small nucleolar RNA-associated protein 25 [Macroventuria anomochaeta]|uniref:U3 small nucleolar RNA-associated protein 25 n=1 Tax=Macroventuria anomochaeta TaxID=301207 RepID=A0ACB6RWC9_9PLEO|nr:U3 small nucleolar RNA-associated protein 25 [Macroventuria anomochaeta]KAF2625239.1 U3 small nucleolar RNA-associated protein 25 [Macroventuria anomochaeta]